MKNKLATFLVILTIGLAGCGANAAVDGSSSEPTSPQAWFDAPLPGSVFVPPNPVSPCQILAHGASPSGIAVFELSINGVAASIPSPDTSSSLATLTQDCNLSQPGEYQLLLRVQDNNGTWSGYAETTLSIASEGSPTPTATPTSTPTLGSVALFSTPTLSTNQFYYGPGTCRPGEVTFGIDLLNSAASQVFLFYRVENRANGAMGDWSEGSAMLSVGSNSFSYMLQGNDIPNLIVPSGMLTVLVNYAVHYQFVAADAGGEIIGRSDVYMDLTLSYCG